MDGTRLSHTQALPKLQGLTTTSTADKSKARGRIVAALATLILVGVMAMVYYVSIRHSRQTTSIAVSPTVEAAQPNAQASPAAATETAAGTQTEGTEKQAGGEPAESSSRSRTPSEASPATKAEPKPSTKEDTTRTIKATSPTKGATQSISTTPKSGEKDESKVRTALKKTGRFFKKALPF
jgi:hypothetical protein